MPQNPATNCCPACPTSPPTTLTCTFAGSSFTLSQTGVGATNWTGSGGTLCGNTINVTAKCEGNNDWTVTVIPLSPLCSNGEVSFQVTNASPVRISFDFVPPGACCQTTPMDGTINE